MAYVRGSVGLTTANAAPHIHLARVPEGKYILNFLYLDPGGVKGEVLTSVTSALRWAGSLPVLEQPEANLFSASTGLDRPPSCLTLHSFPDPGLSCDFAQPPGHTHHLASGTICLSPTVRSLYTKSFPTTPTLSITPSLCTLAGSHFLPSCQTHGGSPTQGP